MSELKTKVNNADANAFLETITDEAKRNDCRTILNIMQKISGDKPKMWGTSIVGFGIQTHTYASGKTGEWFICGFSPRKTNISIYFSLCDLSLMKDGLEKFGKHKTGKSCLYIKKLSDIDMVVFEQMIRNNIKQTKK